MNNTSSTKHNLKPFSQGVLYMVATPIGNLGDITVRALEILKTVDFIACEDTRQTMKLLNHYGISTKCLVCHEHSKERELNKILDLLLSGKSIALVSDAGTPIISDPGANILKLAVEAGINVSPIPGACAAIAALSVGGLLSDGFIFAGFLPNSKKHRRERLDALAMIKSTIILYESPKRVKELMLDIIEVMGDRNVVLAREITKIYEEFLRGRVSQLLENLDEVKGECVVLIEGAQDLIVSEKEIMDSLNIAMKTNSLKDSVEFVAKSLKCPKKLVYSLALNMVKNFK